MKVSIEVQHRIGDTVYHRMDPETKGMVTGFSVRPTGILYCVTWSDGVGEECHHYAMELTDAPDYGAKAE